MPAEEPIPEKKSMFMVGDSSDSEDESPRYATVAVQTDPVANDTELAVTGAFKTPRSLEECVAVFKSDVSVNVSPQISLRVTGITCVFHRVYAINLKMYGMYIQWVSMVRTQ